MPKVKISEYSATANSNTDVASINIDEGCAPSGINNAIRAVMGHLKDFQQGTYGDPFNGPVNGTLGATTAATANVTTLTTSSTVTHNGGTANGVAYLNGSKVLTTGSALTFSGSAFAVTGTISTNNGSANNLLSINGDGAIQSGVQFKANNGGPYTTIYFDNATNHTYYKNLASGGHLFFNNTTQAMTLDASGNLGVGTTSPTSYFSSADNLVVGTTSGNNGITILGGSAATAVLAFGYATGIAAGDGSNRAKIYYDGTSDTLRMSAGGALMSATQFVLDASGNLLVGTTNSSVASAAGFRVYPSGIIASTLAGSTSATDTFEIYSTGASAYRFYVTMDGKINCTSTTIAGISDQRFKENIVDLDAGLNSIMALKPRKFDWKEGKGKDIKGDRGFIAQEFEEVFPDLIGKWKDEPPEGEEPYKTVSADLIPVLVKAIQEQQALITQLTARISALESA